MTTVNYSYGQATRPLLAALLATDERGRHRPGTFGELLGEINRGSIDSGAPVLYGVTGVEGNPRLHPWADPAAIGRPCTTDESCGDPSGNLCVPFGGRTSCAAFAVSRDACPPGTFYFPIARGSRIVGHACLAPN